MILKKERKTTCNPFCTIWKWQYTPIPHTPHTHTHTHTNILTRPLLNINFCNNPLVTRTRNMERALARGLVEFHVFAGHVLLFNSYLGTDRLCFKASRLTYFSLSVIWQAQSANCSLSGFLHFTEAAVGASEKKPHTRATNMIIFNRTSRTKTKEDWTHVTLSDCSCVKGGWTREHGNCGKVTVPETGTVCICHATGCQRNFCKCKNKQKTKYFMTNF